METPADGGLSRGSEVAHPVDLSKSREEIATTTVFEQSYWASPGLSSYPSFYCEESYGSHWDPESEEATGYVVEYRDDPRNISYSDPLGYCGSSFDFCFHGPYRVEI